MAMIPEPRHGYRIPDTQGYLNCFNDGLVFLPDTEPGLALELAHAITHTALGAAGEGLFSCLGEALSKIAGEFTSGKFTEVIMEKLGNKKKMLKKALASSQFFFIPFAELTRFMKKTEHTFFADNYSYVLTYETVDGKKIITCWQNNRRSLTVWAGHWMKWFL